MTDKLAQHSPAQAEGDATASPRGRASGFVSALDGVYRTVSWLWRFLFAGKSGRDMHVIDENIPVDGIDSEAEGGWLNSLFEPLKPAYKQALLMAFGINVIGLFASIFALQVYDRVVAKGGNSTLVALAVGMFIAIGVDFILREGRSALMRRVGAKVEVAIARSVYQRLTQLTTLELESKPPAFWQTVFRDIELIRATATGAPALLLIDLPFTIMTLIVIGIIAPPLFPLAIGLLFAFALLAWRSEQVLKKASETEKEKMMSRDAMLADLSAARIQLKSVGPSELMTNKWEEHYGHWMEEALGRSADGDRFRDISQGMTIASTVIMTSFGAVAILNQLMTMGALIAANILTGKLVGPMVQLVSQWRSYGQFVAAKQRLDQLFDMSLDRQDSPVSLPRPAGTVTMENVHFAYPGSQEQQVIAVSGRLGAGGLHAIVGNNGSGKTTLLKILRGLYSPSEGRVMIDAADIQQFGQNDLAKWIGYLPQQPRLVLGSIKDNLILGSSNVSDESIIHACKLAGAYDFIVSLPEGFDTQVGEAGSRFSNGQRKRIAIAQTIINDPPIILMDEPTSDLDSQAERLFVESMKLLAKDHTVILVTHSPSILTQCDGIVIMDKGRVIAAGKGEDMLPKIGIRQPSVTTIGGDNA
jgi:ATP-binding cassette, subfamily C, bacterial LapB